MIEPTAFVHGGAEFVVSWRLDRDRNRYVLEIKPLVMLPTIRARHVMLALRTFKRRPDFVRPSPPTN